MEGFGDISLRWMELEPWTHSSWERDRKGRYAALAMLSPSEVGLAAREPLNLGLQEKEQIISAENHKKTNANTF